MVSVNLTQAHDQWANRPADERFWTVAEMRGACLKRATATALASVNPRELEGRSDGAEPFLVGPTGTAARFTFSGFGSLAALAGAPANYLRSLPAELAADALTYGLRNGPGCARSLMLTRREEGGLLELRGATSERYARVWDFEVCEALERLAALGWVAPPARVPHGYKGETRTAGAGDVIALGSGGGAAVRVGDEIAPAGLYSSDAEMFAFLVQPEARIELGTGNSLARGVFVRNSETGGGALELCSFLLEGVCGNHIVWGASEVQTLRVAHVGDVRATFDAAGAELERYAESSTRDELEAIGRARRYRLAESADDLVTRLHGARLLPQRTAREAFGLAEQHDQWGGDPLTAWGFVHGLTRLSQREQHADARLGLDRVGGRILELVPR
jgi:hypothetical protein